MKFRNYQLEDDHTPTSVRLWNHRMWAVGQALAQYSKQEEEHGRLVKREFAYSKAKTLALTTT